MSDNESYVNCMFPTASDGAYPSRNYAEEVEEADPAFKPLIIALSMPSNTSNHILVPTRYLGWKPLLQMKWIPERHSGMAIKKILPDPPFSKEGIENIALRSLS